MNEAKIPEGWEPCNPSECAQVWVMLAGDKLPAVKNLDHDMAVRINGEWISEKNWPILGIIPIRKATPPKPIEFVVGDDMLEFLKWVDTLPAGVKPGMKFRQVVEE